MLVKLAQIIEKAIEKVQQEEKNQRQDLYVLAMSYGGHLKAKATMMVKDSDFHQVKNYLCWDLNHLTLVDKKILKILHRLWVSRQTNKERKKKKILPREEKKLKKEKN